MLSKIAGMLSSKNTVNKMWVFKIAIALVLSNLFFYLLFSNNEEVSSIKEPSLQIGWVEVQIRAELKTTYEKGKAILLVERSSHKNYQAKLIDRAVEENNLYVLQVKEEDATYLFEDHLQWEILPVIKNIKFKTAYQGKSHEIRY